MEQPIKLYNLTNRTAYKLNTKMQLRLNQDEFRKYLINTVRFTAPTLAVFFGQLALKVDWKAAGLVALLTLYTNLSDYFKKLEKSK